MREFSSYGPVDSSEHFAVERRELVERCVAQVVGDPAEGGHFFTIWAPRQSGKTWLMRRAMAEVRARHGDRFMVGDMSIQGMAPSAEMTEQDLVAGLSLQLYDAYRIKVEPPADILGWARLFRREGGVFDRPVVLFIDEFDSLPPHLIDKLVGIFRDMYLRREHYFLHGLALIGIRAELGVESARGSPFNVQRSLHVPNLEEAEVTELFRQYQKESGQEVLPEVVAKVYDVTRGQPGLVSWFGELLTDKYNRERGRPIDLRAWDHTYLYATRAELNNTVLNLVKKVETHHTERVLSLFTSANVPFTPDQEWCNYLYMNGLIVPDTAMDARGMETLVCRFSCPFIQFRIYNALTDVFAVTGTPVLPLEPLDELTDVLTPQGLAVPPLLGRYRGYLARLKARGLNPWREQPRRSDLHITEAVGHFHLYAWLSTAIGSVCVVSPEFPTGNGKVDLLLRTKEHTAVVEVKSFTLMFDLPVFREQAAAYARKLGLTEATLAVFVPGGDDVVVERVSGEAVVQGVTVHTVAIAWG